MIGQLFSLKFMFWAAVGLINYLFVIPLQTFETFFEKSKNQDGHGQDGRDIL